MSRTIIIIVVAVILSVVSKILFPDISLHVSVSAESIFPITEGIPFTNAVLVTLIVDVFLILLAFLAASNMQMVPRGLQNVMEAILEALLNLFRSINREYAPRAFPILATIFLFVIVSNWMGLLPGFGSIGYCEAYSGEEQHSSVADTRLAMSTPTEGVAPVGALAEDAEGESPYWGCDPGESLVPFFRAPSADLNVTLALALIAVVMVEYFGFSALGPGYLGKFFNFSGILPFFIGILELISEVARIPAFMFRLFGNIFAGEVLLVVMIFLMPAFVPLPFYAFEVFVGFIQAFIFAVLTMAFVSIAVTPHHDDHGEGHH